MSDEKRKKLSQSDLKKLEKLVSAGDLEGVKAIIPEGETSVLSDPQGFSLYEQTTVLYGLCCLPKRTPDHWAIIRYLVEDVKVDMNKSSFIYVRHGLNETPLNCVIKECIRVHDEESESECVTKSKNEDNIRLLKYLLDNGAEINPMNTNYSPLMDATQSNVELCKLLVERGADVNVEIGDHFSYNPLYFATLHENFEVMKFLLRAGSTVHYAEIYVMVCNYEVFSMEDLKKSEPLILLLLQQKFEDDSYKGMALNMYEDSLKELYFGDRDKQLKIVEMFCEDAKYALRGKWEKKRHGEFSEAFRRFVVFLLWLNDKSELLRILPKDVFIYNVVPFFNEYRVEYYFGEQIDISLPPEDEEEEYSDEGEIDEGEGYAGEIEECEF